MARHRDTTSGHRRGVSGGLVALGVTTVAIAAVVTAGWHLRETLADVADGSPTCLAGQETLHVAASPEIAPALTVLAADFTRTDPVIRDYCVAVAVSAVDSVDAAAGLIARGVPGGQWPATLGPEPQLWVPTSSLQIPKQAANSPLQFPAAVSLATSPVVLATATSEGLASPAGSADTWSALAHSAKSSIGGENPVAAFPLALTDPAARLLALELAEADPDALSGLLRGVDELDRARTESELSALVARATGPGSGYLGVPATAAAARAAGLTALAPERNAVLADYPAVQIQAEWVDETAARAAAEFVTFATAPAQLDAIGANGFDAPAATLAGPAQGPAATEALRRAALEASAGQATLLVIDSSASMATSVGHSTRLAAIASAVKARLVELPDSARVGLWTYSRGLTGTLPQREWVDSGPLFGDTDPASSRRARLEEALSEVSPQTATATNYTLQLAYERALADYQPGKDNRILLITDSASDGSTTLAEVRTTIDTLSDPERPVAIDIIVLGNTETIEATSGLASLSRATGGRYATAGPNVGTDFADVLAEFLR